MKDKKVIGISQRVFTKLKSCLTNLIMLYYEMSTGQYINIWKEVEKEKEPSSLQQWAEAEQEVMGTSWNSRGYIWTTGSTSLLRRWQSTGKDCTKELCSLPPWRYSKAVWTWFMTGDFVLPCSSWIWARWPSEVLSNLRLSKSLWNTVLNSAAWHISPVLTAMAFLWMATQPTGESTNPFSFAISIIYKLVEGALSSRSINNANVKYYGTCYLLWGTF